MCPRELASERPLTSRFARRAAGEILPLNSVIKLCQISFSSSVTCLAPPRSALPSRPCPAISRIFWTASMRPRWARLTQIASRRPSGETTGLERSLSITLDKLKLLLSRLLPRALPKFLNEDLLFDLIEQAHVNKFIRTTLRGGHLLKDISDTFQIRARHGLSAPREKFIGRVDRLHVVDAQVFLEHFNAAFSIGAHVMNCFN